MNESWQRHWVDERNWWKGCIYSCRQDPRVVVPKRPAWTGWTINFAHPWAWPVLGLFIVTGLGPIAAMVWGLHVEDPRAILPVLAGSAAAVVALAARLARGPSGTPHGASRLG